MRLNLVDLMDTYYGAGSWTGRTGVGVGTDIGPALSTGLTSLRGAGGRGVIEIPVCPVGGSWLANTMPNHSLLSGNYIEGEGSQGSLIVYNNANNVMFYYSGFGGFSGGGVKGVGMQLEDGLGDTSSYAVLLKGDTASQPDQCEFEDLYITALGSSYWYNPFQAYGNLRTSPQGIRILECKNIQLFRGRNVGCHLSGVVQASFDNLGIYVGKPGTNGDSMYVTGGTTPDTQTVQFRAEEIAVNGNLNINNCRDVELQGRVYGTVNLDPSADYVNGRIHAGAKVGTLGSHSSLVVTF